MSNFIQQEVFQEDCLGMWWVSNRESEKWAVESAKDGSVAKSTERTTYVVGVAVGRIVSKESIKQSLRMTQL